MLADKAHLQLMHNDRNKPSESPSEAGEGLARRRLLRGAMSLPAVLTVASGSAMAQASNARCVVNANANTTEPPEAGFITGTDTWVRVPGKVQAPTSANPQIFVQLTILNAALDGTSGVVRYTGNNTTGWLQAQDKGALVASSQPPGGAADRNILVRIDANGDIVGVGKFAGGQGAALSITCWQSFNPTFLRGA